MSEKKAKEERHTLKLPTFDNKLLLEELTRISHANGFDAERLTSYIIADWLVQFYVACDKCKDGDQSPFLSYLATISQHFVNFKEFLKDEKKSV